MTVDESSRAAFESRKKPQQKKLLAAQDPHLDLQQPELQRMLGILPERFTQALQHAFSGPDALSGNPLLIELALDVGRPAEARFLNGSRLILPGEAVTQQELDATIKRLGKFTSDNRAGIAATLHRISAIRNRAGKIIGLTCRVGRAVYGSVSILEDLIRAGKSMLILGAPGTGKTTKLREIARILSDELGQRVVIVDTSNEIAGDGDIPHPSIGSARRMQVSDPFHQQQVMIEAVENHMPQVIIVDEIGTGPEAAAARTIAERGVTLIATAHGVTLQNLIKNPVLCDLIGGIQSVTLSDEEAKRRGTQKTVLEREKLPTFDILVELHDYHTMAIYADVSVAVDRLLKGWPLAPELRQQDPTTGEHISQLAMPATPVKLAPEAPWETKPLPIQGPQLEPGQKPFRVFLSGISRSFLERVIDRLQLQGSVEISTSVYKANAILAVKNQLRPGSKLAQLAQTMETPLVSVKGNTIPAVFKGLKEAIAAVPEYNSLLCALDTPTDFPATPTSIEEFIALLLEETAGNPETLALLQEALREAQHAAESALNASEVIELKPQDPKTRKLQHELVEQYSLVSFSVGDEPNRRLRVLPPIATTP
ncbi:MAG: R3H domain-containing nucleic acid-binding protein [Vampirovibrionales bacterium]|nr:R3H domain-containing nucleic acid-binding protein [Vampirovibrionales bacterium]